MALEIEELRELSKTFDKFYERGIVGVMENSIQVNELDFARLTVGKEITTRKFGNLESAKCDMGGFSLISVIIQHKRTK